MNAVATVIRWSAGCSVCVLGFAGARRALKARTQQPERIALAAAVGLLGLTSFFGRLQEATSQRIPVITEISLIAFIGSAYCILRVRHAIAPLSRRALRTAGIACGGAAVLVATAN